jgi:cell wall-associated NlpC family hydrolase
MSWASEYTRRPEIPYVIGGSTRNGVDCWGIVVLVYREQLEIELPHYSADWAGDYELAEIDRVVRGAASKWIEVHDAPRAFDVHTFRGQHGKVEHIGVDVGITGGWMLHARRQSPRQEQYGTRAWQKFYEATYRHPSTV